MQLSDFDHVSTELARELRDSAKRVGLKLAREKGEGAPEVCAAKLVYIFYSALVEAREGSAMRCVSTERSDIIPDMLAPDAPRVCAHAHLESIERGALCWPVAGAERAALERANRIVHRDMTFEPVASGVIAITTKVGTARFFGLAAEGPSDATVRIDVSVAIAVRIARQCNQTT